MRGFQICVSVRRLLRLLVLIIRTEAKASKQDAAFHAGIADGHGVAVFVLVFADDGLHRNAFAASPKFVRTAPTAHA